MANLLKRLNARNFAGDYTAQLLEAFKNEEFEAGPDASAHDAPSHLSPHNQALLDPLTRREIEILEFLARRLSNREIAEKLFISPGTAKLHTIKIYRKLDVHSRREAVAKAGEIGLLP
ncbi:MAG: response regulator transcription factor [bacterium]|nr:response regulator transcription factor [bacterium]